jgi:predicted metal-dependent HD superfamily phosphohydrolase
VSKILQEAFTGLLSRYLVDDAIISTHWQEILTSYSSRKRHYHTLVHLENLWLELQPVQQQLTDGDAVLFALFYHDAVYQATKGDNEEQSAALAEQRMQAMQLPGELISKTTQLILATKGHVVSTDADTNNFTDADLSVLGSSPENYKAYANAIRKEYRIYPDFLYKPGRKKVLQQLLSMERIFKTPYFFEKYEAAARMNMKAELGWLQ